MYEYITLESMHLSARKLNEYAQQGYRLIATVPTWASKNNLLIMEREVTDIGKSQVLLEQSELDPTSTVK